MKKTRLKSEDGSAIIIALLILTLLTAFVALAVSRTTSETIASSNDAAESRAFSAGQGCLEVMTRNFDKIFEEKLSPAPADLDHVKSLKPPGFETLYEFGQDITQTEQPRTVVMSGEFLQGLNALRDEWRVDCTATDVSNGVQVALRRKFYNNRVPIFQFGIFYDDDLEFHPGPRFDFGGRVHSNGSLFMMAGTGLYFSSRVSAVGQVLTDVSRNGRDWSGWGENVWIKNGSGNYVKLTHGMGSVLKTPVNGAPVFSNPDMPTVYKNSSWNTTKELFQGNLLAEQKALNLPLKIASQIAGAPLDYSELIKRGKNVGDLFNGSTTAIPNIKPVTPADADSIITSKERYFNKKGIRISLADSKAKLPGCASGTGTTPVSGACGVRLDGASSGSGGASDANGSRGYQPKPMIGSPAYQATRLNGGRLTGETWIKIELVAINQTNNQIEPQDVTEDVLSLGVTEAAPFALSLSGYGNRDTRSVIKLQRFAMPGSTIAANMVAGSDTNPHMSYVNLGGTSYNVVEARARTISSGVPGIWTVRDAVNGTVADHDAHIVCVPQPATSGTQTCYAPFPIKLFDSREGVYDFTINTNSVYGAGNVPRAGVMSLIDIDVANMKKFLDGNFDNNLPSSGTPFSNAAGRSLKSADVPQANGWVIYVSDRRGDYDFDGEYDMEDVFGNNDGIKQPGEDVNNNGRLDADYFNEAVRYTGAGSFLTAAQAASVDHTQYRRAVRLINGQTLPGIYDAGNPLNTKGFTVSSENGVYVLGNYNATGITTVGTPTAATNYMPQGTASHIPASVVADAVSILSNNWTDARSFSSPFSDSGRVASETTVRFAMLTGDARSSLENTPNQGNSDPRLSGGVHNFKRFLENWNNIRLNYCGSLINLFNSQNSNGTYKNSGLVRTPPTRNWVFDTSFLDPSRLPPGTPFFQNIQLTGFQRVN